MRARVSMHARACGQRCSDQCPTPTARRRRPSVVLLAPPPPPRPSPNPYNPLSPAQRLRPKHQGIPTTTTPATTTPAPTPTITAAAAALVLLPHLPHSLPPAARHSQPSAANLAPAPALVSRGNYSPSGPPTVS
ncbi:hypothetical protein ACJBU6_11123 [Exserohilum turcicum]